MTFSMATLLIHSDDVPPGARDALRAARTATRENGEHLRRSAARIIHAETELGCVDIRELVDLTDGDCD